MKKCKKIMLCAAMAAIGAMTAVPAAAQAASVSSDSAAVSQAAPETKTTDKKDTSSLVSKWFTDDKGRIFYYGKDGKPLTGEQVIDGSYYLFSANGVQKTGWRTVNGHRCYFDPKTGKQFLCSAFSNYGVSDLKR